MIAPMAQSRVERPPVIGRICFARDLFGRLGAPIWLNHYPHRHPVELHEHDFLEVVLVTGGHADGATVVNRWFGPGRGREWRWPRLPGLFHGSGCTLAAAIAARLACGDGMERALGTAQAYCHGALADAFSIAPGQRIPLRANSNIF
jgi:hydroxymethylpyrimidine/phosphomethylpyrimidine kinase